MSWDTHGRPWQAAPECLANPWLGTSHVAANPETGEATSPPADDGPDGAKGAKLFGLGPKAAADHFEVRQLAVRGA